LTGRNVRVDIAGGANCSGWGGRDAASCDGLKPFGWYLIAAGLALIGYLALH
jgi:hypothetical protein